MILRTPFVLGFSLLMAVGCTGDVVEPSSDMTPACSPGPGCGLEVTSGETRYELECVAVPEALVDIELPKVEGRRPIRAITGVSATQGVAVMWRDLDGCGLWVLGLAGGVSEETASAIREEMARGIERFGVTASPVPDVPGES